MSAPAEADVCILGAGPHGLAAAVHLRRARPDLPLVAIDPAGAWMAGWHEQFARAEIDALRSPIVHHPAPDPYELSDYADRYGLPRSGLPYDPPTTVSFASFCADLAASAELEPPSAARAESIRREGRGVVVSTDRGEVRAAHLIVATNPHRRAIPEWVWPLLGARAGLVVYGTDVDLRDVGDLDGQRIAVVGGGLTAAHLACGAATRGADVHLVTRRPVETRDFDTDPGWLGPKFLRDFNGDDNPISRLRTAAAARGGGTIPRWMRARLDAHVDDDRLALVEGRAVRAAGIDTDGSGVLALDDGTTIRVDRIWLATGTEADLGASRCLDELAADVPVLHGLPITDDSLRVGPHTGAHHGPAGHADPRPGRREPLGGPAGRPPHHVGTHWCRSRARLRRPPAAATVRAPGGPRLTESVDHH